MMTPPLARTSWMRSGPGLGGWLGSLGRTGRILVIGVEVLLILVIWQLAVDVFGWIKAVFLPSPLGIVGGFGELLSAGTLAENATISIQAWFIGFGLAVVIGIPVGLLMGASLPVEKVFGPIAWTIYATPAVAYQPLSKAWFGFGIGPVVFLVAISAVFPLLLNVAAGVRTTSPSLVNAAKVYGATRLDLYRRVYLPSVVPFLFAGLRQAAVLATIGMVVAELTGSSSGIGAVIIRSANTYQTDQSFAAILLVVIWSVGMTRLVTVVERVVAPWTKPVTR